MSSTRQHDGPSPAEAVATLPSPIETPAEVAAGRSSSSRSPSPPIRRVHSGYVVDSIRFKPSRKRRQRKGIARDPSGSMVDHASGHPLFESASSDSEMGARPPNDESPHQEDSGEDAGAGANDTAEVYTSDEESLSLSQAAESERGSDEDYSSGTELDQQSHDDTDRSSDVDSDAEGERGSIDGSESDDGDIRASDEEAEQLGNIPTRIRTDRSESLSPRAFNASSPGPAVMTSDDDESDEGGGRGMSPHDYFDVEQRILQKAENVLKVTPIDASPNNVKFDGMTSADFMEIPSPKFTNANVSSRSALMNPQTSSPVNEALTTIEKFTQVVQQSAVPKTFVTVTPRIGTPRSRLAPPVEKRVRFNQRRMVLSPTGRRTSEQVPRDPLEDVPFLKSPQMSGKKLAGVAEMDNDEAPPYISYDSDNESGDDTDGKPVDGAAAQKVDEADNKDKAAPVASSMGVNPDDEDAVELSPASSDNDDEDDITFSSSSSESGESGDEEATTTLRDHEVGRTVGNDQHDDGDDEDGSEESDSGEESDDDEDSDDNENLIDYKAFMSGSGINRKRSMSEKSGGGGGGGGRSSLSSSQRAKQSKADLGSGCDVFASTMNPKHFVPMNHFDAPFGVADLPTLHPLRDLPTLHPLRDEYNPTPRARSRSSSIDSQSWLPEPLRRARKNSIASDKHDAHIDAIHRAASAYTATEASNSTNTSALQPNGDAPRRRGNSISLSGTFSRGQNIRPPSSFAAENSVSHRGKSRRKSPKRKKKLDAVHPTANGRKPLDESAFENPEEQHDDAFGSEKKVAEREIDERVMSDGNPRSGEIVIFSSSAVRKQTRRLESQKEVQSSASQDNENLLGEHGEDRSLLDDELSSVVIHHTKRRSTLQRIATLSRDRMFAAVSGSKRSLRIPDSEASGGGDDDSGGHNTVPSHVGQDVVSSGGAAGVQERVSVGVTTYVSVLMLSVVAFGVLLSFGAMFGPLGDAFQMGLRATALVGSLRLGVALFSLACGLPFVSLARKFPWLGGALFAASGVATYFATAPWMLLVFYSAIGGIATSLTLLFAWSIISPAWSSTSETRLAMTFGVGALGVLIYAQIIEVVAMNYGWQWAVLAEALISASICFLSGIIARNLPLLGDVPPTSTSPLTLTALGGPKIELTTRPISRTLSAKAVSSSLPHSPSVVPKNIDNTRGARPASQNGAHKNGEKRGSRPVVPSNKSTPSTPRTKDTSSRKTRKDARASPRASQSSARASRGGGAVANKTGAAASPPASPSPLQRSATSPLNRHANFARSASARSSSRDLLNTLRRQGAEGPSYREGAGGGRAKTMLPNSRGGGRQRRPRRSVGPKTARSTGKRTSLRREEKRRRASAQPSGSEERRSRASTQRSGSSRASTSSRDRDRTKSRKAKGAKQKPKPKRSKSARRVRSVSPPSVPEVRRGSTERPVRAAPKRRRSHDAVDEVEEEDSFVKTLPALHLMLPAPYHERGKAQQKRRRTGGRESRQSLVPQGATTSSAPNSPTNASISSLPTSRQTSKVPSVDGASSSVGASRARARAKRSETVRQSARPPPTSSSSPTSSSRHPRSRSTNRGRVHKSRRKPPLPTVWSGLDDESRGDSPTPDRDESRNPILASRSSSSDRKPRPSSSNPHTETHSHTNGNGASTQNGSVVPLQQQQTNVVILDNSANKGLDAMFSRGIETLAASLDSSANKKANARAASERANGLTWHFVRSAFAQTHFRVVLAVCVCLSFGAFNTWILLTSSLLSEASYSADAFARLPLFLGGAVPVGILVAKSTARFSMNLLLCASTLLLSANGFLWTVAHNSVALTTYAVAFGFTFGVTLTLLVLLARSYCDTPKSFMKTVTLLALFMAPGCVLGPVFAATVFDMMDDVYFAGIANSLPVFIAFVIVCADRCSCRVSTRQSVSAHDPLSSDSARNGAPLSTLMV